MYVETTSDDNWLSIEDAADGLGLGAITNPSVPLEIMSWDYKYTLHITDGFFYKVFKKRPNWWWRLWQWLLLGWRWGEEENKDESTHSKT